jgi:hypothetical protein
MKKYCLLIVSTAFSVIVFSQQKTISQGYLELKVKYLAESDLDMPPPPPPPPPLAPGMDMPAENNTGPSAQDGYDIYIWFNPGFEKVVNTIYGRSTYLFNTKNKTTISLKEISGNKYGTIATPEDEEFVNNYLDSLYGRKKEIVPHAPVVKYFDSTKAISGYNCKKALLITEIENTKNDTVTVWYYPDLKLSNNFIFYTDKPEYKNKLSKLHLINGLPLSASFNLTQKTKLEIQLVKIDTDKKISDKEFLVSKDFELKTFKEVNGL